MLGRQIKIKRNGDFGCVGRHRDVRDRIEEQGMLWANSYTLRETIKIKSQ